MPPTKELILAIPERGAHVSRPVTVSILFSLLIHVFILSVVFSARWWVKPIDTPGRQAFNVWLELNTFAPDKIPLREVIEPVPQLDLATPTANSSVGLSPPAVDKVEPGRDVSEPDRLVTPSGITNDSTSVDNPLPAIDLDAAFSLAREVGRMSEAESTGTEVHSDSGTSTRSEKIRLAVVSAWSPPPSCYRAYSGMGLFAIPFLLKDTLSDGGCEW